MRTRIFRVKDTEKLKRYTLQQGKHDMNEFGKVLL